jgi:Ran GTPase-activating protein (RanGAP) involved in mRNA processing and transport
MGKTLMLETHLVCQQFDFYSKLIFFFCRHCGGFCDRLVFRTAIVLENQNITEDAIIEAISNHVKTHALTTLKLGNLPLTTKFIGFLTGLINKATPNLALEYLDVSDAKFGVDGLRDLLSALTPTAIKQLYVRGNKLDVEGGKLLAQFLTSNKSLVLLDTRGNNHLDDGIGPILATLEGGDSAPNTSLRALDIGANQVKLPIFQQLSRVFATNTRLQEFSIWWSGRDFNVEAGLALAEGVRKNKSLVYLDVAMSFMDQLGLKAMAEAVLVHPTLKTVLFTSPHAPAGDICSQAIAELIEKSTTLEEIEAYSMGIEDYGAKLLAQALQKNSSLKVLRINNNQIFEEGIVELCKGLVFNQSLEVLWLNLNPMTEAAVAAIARLLVFNESIKELRLAECGLSTETSLGLAKALVHNASLQTLDLSMNEIDKDVWNAYFACYAELGKKINVIL